MTLKEINPIEQDEKGNITLLNFNSDEANSDPIRAARLMDKVNKGDKEAIAELNRLENQKMYKDD